MKKILLKRFKIIICILFGICLGQIMYFNTSVNASTIQNVIIEDNNTIEENYDKEFDLNSLIIVLKPEFSQYSGVSEILSMKLFEFEQIDSLKDLTEVPSDILLNEYTLINSSSETIDYLKRIEFKQIIKINLKTNSKQDVINVINKIKGFDEVLYVGPNYIYSSSSSSIVSSIIDKQWGLSGDMGINISEAWKFSTGTKKVRVGVMDTGIAIHEDLNSNLVRGYDYVNKNSITYDDEGSHGTGVAGIIGANGKNSIGMYGVNHEVSLVPLQTAWDTSGTGRFRFSDIAEAINDVRNLWDTPNRISIINLSVSGFGYSIDVLSAVEQFPGLFIWAAGNEGENLDSVTEIENFSLDNLISVGAHDRYNNRSIFSMGSSSNYGNAVDIYAPGGGGSDDEEGYCYSTYSRSENSYNYFRGTSFSAPHVTGVAALLLSLNENLSAVQLKQAILQSADEITITVPDTTEGAEEDDVVEQHVLKLNAYNAVKYVLKNFSNTAYLLSNYSSTINTNKTIASDASYFDELNGFYKLNVTYAKNYEFISSSTNGIEVTLYDEEFDEILYSDLDLSNNKVHFINNLNVGTYYLRIKYTDEDNTGTINTKIVSRNTVYLSNGINDILINTYNGISEYIYAHNQGAGFYKFKLNVDNITSYQSGTIKIYIDQERTILLDRFENDVFFYTASSNTNENEMYVFLPSNGTYYIDILLNNINYFSVTLEIEEVEVKDLNYSASLSSPSFNSIFESVNKYNYFEKVIVDATSKVQIDVIANGTLSGYVPILMFKEEVNLQTPVNNREYYLQTVVFGEANSSNYFPTYTVVVDPGTYYIGYILNDEKVFMSIGLTRLVEYSDNMDDVLVADPYYIGYDLGTEVLLNNGNCDNYTITEGFTRNIYLMVEDRLSDPMSRLQYDWYSSNESIATVSNYGTVLAMPVENNTTVTIFAVLKEDPSIVYFKTFTILNGEEEDFLEISLEMSYSYSEENGTYQLELTNTNCPYPMIQYYNWTIINENDETVSLNYWGQVTSTGPGEYVILGTYALNPRVRIYINLSITD